jgi:hypothetical protein
VMDGLILLCWVIFFGSVMAAGLTLRHAFTLRRQRHERETPTSRLRPDRGRCGDHRPQHLPLQATAPEAEGVALDVPAIRQADADEEAAAGAGDPGSARKGRRRSTATASSHGPR